MNERPETPADPLEGLAPPRAPAELRARVLAASRAALAAVPYRPDPWSLLFTSWPIRLAWAACVVLLLVGHGVLVRPARPPGEAAAFPLSRSVRDADAELAAIGHLPRLDPDARPLGGGPGVPPQPPALPARQLPKENRT